MISGEKILVTGASGLVGMELVCELAKDNEVWGLSRYLEPEGRAGAINAWAVTRQEVEAIGARTFAADLLGDFNALPTDFTYLIHLAHTRLPNDRLQEAIEANSLGAGRIMHHCRRAKAALIMSSTAVYTPPTDVWTLLKEGDPLGGAQPPFHNFTSPPSKISLEAVSQFCASEFGLRTVIARAGVVYGRNGGLPTRDLQRVIGGETLARYGDPYVHSPIHFDDMNEQIEALMDAAATKANIVNWCGDEIVTQRNWCEQAAQLSGQPLKVEHTLGAPGDACDPTKRRSITGPCRLKFAEAFAEIYRAHRAGVASAARQLEISRQNSGNFSPA
jgi:nucleoside-diphosphate-sugar epimerase